MGANHLGHLRNLRHHAPRIAVNWKALAVNQPLGRSLHALTTDHKPIWKLRSCRALRSTATTSPNHFLDSHPRGFLSQQPLRAMCSPLDRRQGGAPSNRFGGSLRKPYEGQHGPRRRQYCRLMILTRCPARPRKERKGLVSQILRQG